MVIGGVFDFRPSQVNPVEEILPQNSTLSIIGLNYTVTEWMGPWWKGACFRRQRKKIVLNDVTMQLKTGQITAILGNSGSGKTSLLDVIAGRSSGRTTGHVYVNNTACSRQVIKQRATYVMQADRLLPNLTIRETLRYTARLKLPGKTNIAEIEAKVHKVIIEMGLKDVADSRVGGSIIRGISGGEQRRVTIAIQLLKDPEIILLDEPTSGLDSHTARYLVSNLRDLAHNMNKMVLLTIHQPSSDIFSMFDQIGILSHGEVVYFGGAEEMVPYFTDIGYPCNAYTNPLDRYVDVASIDRRDKVKEAESFERVNKLVNTFRGSTIHNETLQAVVEDTMKPSPKNKDTMLRSRTDGPGYFRIMYTLLSRMNVNLFRDRKDYIARIFLLPLFMVFIMIFLGHLKHTQSSIQDRIGLIYQSSTVPAFMGMINSVALFPSLRDLYYRESRDGLYGTATFLIAYSLHCLPFHILASAIFSSMTYWITGMYPDAERFGLYTTEIFILHYWGEILCIGCMAVFMNPNQANSLSALLQAASVLISSGLLKSVSALEKPFQWLSWALMHKYVGEQFVVNEFKDLEFECEANKTCVPNGNDYIAQFYPGGQNHVARNFGAMVAYALGTLILAMIVFKLRGLRNLH